jgi:hypothetical protein
MPLVHAGARITLSGLHGTGTAVLTNSRGTACLTGTTAGPPDTSIEQKRKQAAGDVPHDGELKIPAFGRRRLCRLTCGHHRAMPGGETAPKAGAPRSRCARD